jgi:hypothetical protein
VQIIRILASCGIGGATNISSIINGSPGLRQTAATKFATNIIYIHSFMHTHETSTSTLKKQINLLKGKTKLPLHLMGCFC